MHSAFEDMIAHPAPGIWFDAHERAGVPARLIPTRHVPRKPAWRRSLRLLRKRLDALPDRGESLVKFYTRHNGVELCILPDPLNNSNAAALTMLPIKKMDTADELIRWMHEGLEHIYRPGSYLPIATSPSEGTVLNLLLEGELDGRSLAGTIFYLSSDPVLTCSEPIADSFDDLLSWIAKEPARFLNSIGYCSAVKGVAVEDGWFGDPPERYVADMRAEQARCE